MDAGPAKARLASSGAGGQPQLPVRPVSSAINDLVGAAAAKAKRPAEPAPVPEPAPASSKTPAIATTGVAGLDAQLGGGIPRGTTLLVIGEPGNAIPLFSEQFAGGGLDAGEDAHFFQFDRPCGDIRKAIRTFVLRGNEGKADLTLYDGYAPQFRGAGGTKLRDPESVGVSIKEAVPTMMAAIMNQPAGRPYRVVIESLSALAREENERELLDFVKNLVYLGHETGGLHLISIVKGLHSPAFEAQLKHLVGGVIEFGAERKGFGIYNYLVVSKLLKVQDPVRILLWKETDKGLWLESTKRVF